MPTFQANSALTSGTYTGDYNWNTGLNWDTGTVPTDGANLVLPTLSAAYTSVDDIAAISGLNLSIGDNVSLIVALGDTSVENINAFGNNSLFQTDGSSTVSIGNGLGGTYAVNGPTASLNIAGFNGVGTFELFGGTIDFGTNANLSAGNSFNFEGDTSGNLVISSPNNYQNGWSFPVAHFAQGDTITFGTSFFTPGTYTDAYDATAHTLTLPIPTGSGSYVFHNFSLAAGAPTTFDVTSTSITDVTCFAANTRILTDRGEVAVEKLAIGDLVVTASGGARPIKWLGHRDRRLAAPIPIRDSAFPIRIAADAFGPNRPSQDLYLSSGHSVCVDLVGEVFIPAGYLINGATIAQVEVDEVSYWHVELDSHDILIANNLPAESYMAMGNRGFFEERRGLLPAIEEERKRTHADFCRPVVLDGPVLAFARQRLQTRAEAIGWTRSFETDLHLVVDGEVRRPLSEGDAAVFLFPASAREVRLKSNTFIPDLLGVGDPRPLGVSLTGLVFLGGRGDVRPVDLDDDAVAGRALSRGGEERRRLAMDQGRTRAEPGHVGRSLRIRRPARDLQPHRDAPMARPGEGAGRGSVAEERTAATACRVTSAFGMAGRQIPSFP